MGDERKSKADTDWTVREDQDSEERHIRFDLASTRMMEFLPPDVVSEDDEEDEEAPSNKLPVRPSQVEEPTAPTEKRRKSAKKSITVDNLEVDLGPELAIDGFNLETWWLQAPTATRMNLALLLMLLSIGIIYLIAAICFMSMHAKQTIRNPYVCETEKCRQASQWLTTAMNDSIDPCDNFYQYVCGNYRYESDSEREDELLIELLADSAFKVEFGASSTLAKLLNNFRNDEVYDQPIRYYQACLNEPNRKEFGLSAFIDTVEKIFGTRNFSSFEGTSLSLEQIGANMLSHTGDATYINMAFYTYPYIAILRPSRKIRQIFQWGPLGLKQEELILRIFLHLMPHLGVKNQKLIEAAYGGVEIFGRIESIIYTHLKFQRIPKTLALPPDIMDIINMTVNKQLAGYCPPLGIQLNIRELLGLYIQEPFRYEFYDTMALKYFIVFELCFQQNPRNFTIFEVSHPKLSFVAPWLFGMFWDFLPSMDTIDLMAHWGISLYDLPNNELVREIDAKADQNIEVRCMLDMGKRLGYLPLLQYLTSKVESPLEYLQGKKTHILQMYADTIKWFGKIPASELDLNEIVLAAQIFGRDIHVDVVMPLFSGTLVFDNGRKAYMCDWLNFSQDHLRNSFIATKYTVESARLNWLGSTNSEPTIKWWGSGSDGAYEVQDELFDIRRTVSRSAEFNENLDEVAGITNGNQWHKFLGRPHPNYLFYFLTIFDEPFNEEALFLEASGVDLKIIKTVYSLISEARSNRYTSYFGRAPKYYALINKGWARLNRNRTCSRLWIERETPNVTDVIAHSSETQIFGNAWKRLRYEFIFRHNLTTGEYSWELDQAYHGLLALKQSFELLHHRRKSLSKERFSWRMEERKRKLVLQKLLPGKLLKDFTEEQLFFIALVRNMCRGSWRTHYDELREERFVLENTVLSLLMQMEEFGTTWKCKKDAFMNNMDYPRCIQWTPNSMDG